MKTQGQKGLIERLASWIERFRKKWLNKLSAILGDKIIIIKGQLKTCLFIHCSIEFTSKINNTQIQNRNQEEKQD